MSQNNRELSEEEISFIEESLSRKRVRVDIDENNQVNISKEVETSSEKRKRSLYRKYKMYLIFLRITAVIPFVLSFVIILIAASFSNFAHGDVSGMIEQMTIVSQSSEIVSEESLQSLKAMAQLYDSRWIAIAAIFTFFGIITFIFSLLYWWKKEEYETLT